jgi:hypothetical protein
MDIIKVKSFFCIPPLAKLVRSIFFFSDFAATDIYIYIYIYILKSVFTYLNLVNFLFIEKYFFKELFKLKESEHIEVLKNTRCRSYCQNLTLKLFLGFLLFSLLYLDSLTI